MFTRIKVRRLVDTLSIEMPRTSSNGRFARVAQTLIEGLNKENKIYELNMRLKIEKIYAAIAGEAERKKENTQAVTYYVYAAREIEDTFKRMNLDHLTFLQKLSVFNTLLDAKIYLDRANRLMHTTATNADNFLSRGVPSFEEIRACRDRIEHTINKLKRLDV